jgi:hypothetical protein
MITHSFPIQNLDQITDTMGWYRTVFDQDIKYDIKPRYSAFAYDMIIKFQNEQELSLFLLKFGEQCA